jgi:hypothetical protein
MLDEGRRRHERGQTSPQPPSVSPEVKAIVSMLEAIPLKNLANDVTSSTNHSCTTFQAEAAAADLQSSQVCGCHRMTRSYVETRRNAPKSLRLIQIGLLCGFVAIAQINSATLRSAFGVPIAKGPGYEVLRSKGIDLTIKFSRRHRRVCSVEIKPGQADAKTVEAIMDQAVPIVDRGKMRNRLDEYDGLAGDRTTYYDKLIIREDIYTSRALDKRPGAIAIVKDLQCGWREGDDPFDSDHNPI